jgi:hypothetical protein
MTNLPTVFIIFSMIKLAPHKAGAAFLKSTWDATLAAPVNPFIYAG